MSLKTVAPLLIRVPEKDSLLSTLPVTCPPNHDSKGELTIAPEHSVLI